MVLEMLTKGWMVQAGIEAVEIHQCGFYMGRCWVRGHAAGFVLEL